MSLSEEEKQAEEEKRTWEGQVKTEAETCMMLSQAREHPNLPEAGGDKGVLPWSTQGSVVLRPLDGRLLAFRVSGKQISVVGSHHICGNL